MSNQGDDCYYYFYSSCTKGDSCTFRHCEAAIGNETVCTLWEEGRCFRQVCKFRHMKIDKKRSEIPCYWETQPSGCQKSNCAFHHTKERYVDGKLLPPSRIKTFKNVLECSDDEMKTAHHFLSQVKPSTIPNTSTRLRGVIKVDNETVPSPTHPPVVINATADDDDDDGGRVGIGKRNLNQAKSNADQSCLLANVVPTSLCTDSALLQNLPRTEKTNLSVLRTVTLSTSSGDEPCSQLTLTERLEKCRKHLSDEDNVGHPLKRSLAERLGRKIKLPERSENEVSQLKVHNLKSIKERLGFPSDMSCEESEEFHIKTLREIKLEKLSQKQKEAPHHKVCTALVTENPSDTDQSGIHIKSFMEVLAEKKLRQMEEAKCQTAESMKNRQNAQEKTHNMPAYVKLKIGEAQQAVATGKKRISERVRVKTLEEIKREKALRQQKVENAKKTSEAEPFRGRRIGLRAKTNAMNEEKLKMEASILAAPQTTQRDLNQTCLDLHTDDTNTRVLVKSFEEIIREKRQRQQQEAAGQLIKERALQEPSPVDGDSENGNSHPALATATEEPVKASGLLQKRLHHSSRGRNKNPPLGKRKVSPSLKAPASPVQDEQSSQLRSLKLSSRAKLLEPSSLLSSQQPISLENPCHPSTSKKPQHSSLPARTQNPVLLPLRAQQLSSQVKPQQPTSPIKPLQSSLQVPPQEPSSPLISSQFSTPVSFSQPSSPVKAHHPSSPVQDQTFPITARQPGMLQQPSKIQTQQLPQIVPNDLSETEIVQEEDTLITVESSTINKPGQATKKGKGKPKASVKPSIGKKPALPKGPQKRKGAKSGHAVVAAVKPLTPSTSTMMSESSTKKAVRAIADSSSKEAMQPPKTCLEILAKSADSVDLQQRVPAHVAEMASSEMLPPPAKIRRTSSSAPKTPLPAEDEIDKLMWELSGGHLEDAEIDLDASKDEDDLLLELSEMIDS